MASKQCPSCKLVNPASSTMCDCGFPFEDSIAHGDLVRSETKRCPSCLRFQPTALATCTCGFDLAMPAEQLRAMLVGERTSARIGIALGALGVIAGCFIVVVATAWSIVPVGMIVAGGTWFGRSVRQLSRCRELMRSSKFGELPAAKLLDR